MWGLLLVVIVLGGIYGGVFTPTEAAAVVAVYSFLIVNFMYRDLGPLRGVAWRREGEAAAAAAWRGLRDTARGLALAAAHPDNRRVLVESSRTTVMLMFIIANALLFAHVLTTERVPQTVTSFMIGAGFEWWSFLIAVNLLLLLGGQFYGAVGLASHRGAGGVSAGAGIGNRSDSSGNYDGRQYGNRVDHPAGGA